MLLPALYGLPLWRRANGNRGRRILASFAYRTFALQRIRF
jgi:hypothetical protein